MKHRIIKPLAGTAMAIALVLAGVSTASAKDNTPGHIKNGKYVPGCTQAELTSETGGGDIVGGANVTYVAPANGNTGTFDFTFLLNGKSCTQLDYRVDVYQYSRTGFIDDSTSTPIASSHTAGDFTSSTLAANTVTIPADYTAEDPCITVVVRSLNGTTQLDRAPDFGSNDVCAGEGGSQLWR
jgi:hypothetical protein